MQYVLKLICLESQIACHCNPFCAHQRQNDLCRVRHPASIPVQPGRQNCVRRAQARALRHCAPRLGRQIRRARQKGV